MVDLRTAAEGIRSGHSSTASRAMISSYKTCRGQMLMYHDGIRRARTLAGLGLSNGKRLSELASQANDNIKKYLASTLSAYEALEEYSKCPPTMEANAKLEETLQEDAMGCRMFPKRLYLTDWKERVSAAQPRPGTAAASSSNAERDGSCMMSGANKD